MMEIADILTVYSRFYVQKPTVVNMPKDLSCIFAQPATPEEPTTLTSITWAGTLVPSLLLQRLTVICLSLDVVFWFDWWERRHQH